MPNKKAITQTQKDTIMQAMFIYQSRVCEQYTISIFELQYAKSYVFTVEQLDNDGESITGVINDIVCYPSDAQAVIAADEFIKSLIAKPKKGIKTNKKTIVHVNQHVIKENKKTGKSSPPLTVKTYSSNNYGSEVEIKGDCKVIYSPDNPLPCGATVWIETTGEVIVLR